MRLISVVMLVAAVICFGAAALIAESPRSSKLTNWGLALFAGAAVVEAAPF